MNMVFDKNQSSFPSDFHREVWWWAIGIVPPECSLTDEVRAMCSPEVLEGCRQWHSYFYALSEDMYGNSAEYAPASARQYRDILEKISATGTIGKDGSVNFNGDKDNDKVSIDADAMIWDAGEWEKYRVKTNKSKQFTDSGATVEACLRALARTGLEFKLCDTVVAFSHTVYPKIFHAMRAFERSPRVRETPARHHFAHCEFRQLFRSYNANYDELMRRASDESLYVAKAIHEYCISRKIQRYTHFGIIKYKHKNIRVLDYNLYGNEYPTLRVNVGPFRINPHKEDIDTILSHIADRIASIDSDSDTDV